MMDTEHIDNIKMIRSMMERSVKFVSLSGLSGITIGITALVAVGLVVQKLGGVLSHDDISLIKQSREIKIYFLAIAISTLTVSLSLSFFFNSRKARKMKLKTWDNTSRRFLFNLFFPIMTGAVLIMVMVVQGVYIFICGIMLIFYGIALLNSSKYAHDEIQYLGIMEVLLGIIASHFHEFGVLMWGVGFGILNAVYGIIIYVKYEK